MTDTALPRILALDLARVTGWAYGRAGDVPKAGSVELAISGSGNGTTGRGLLRWMTGFVALSPVDIAYIEAPLDPRHMGKKSNMMTARQLMGLAYLAETILEASGIYRVREADVQDVREVFVGQRRPPNGKDDVALKCRKLGWAITDNDAADAAALWAFACHVEAKGTPLVQGNLPLFFKPAPRRSDDIEEIPE